MARKIYTRTAESKRAEGKTSGIPRVFAMSPDDFNNAELCREILECLERDGAVTIVDRPKKKVAPKNLNQPPTP